MMEVIQNVNAVGVTGVFDFETHSFTEMLESSTYVMINGNVMSRIESSLFHKLHCPDFKVTYTSKSAFLVSYVYSRSKCQ